MALDKIREVNKIHIFTDEAVGELRFHEPTARQAMGWSYKLLSIFRTLNLEEDQEVSQDDVQKILNTKLDVMLDVFISCYLPDHEADAASERDAEVAFRLTGGWRDGKLADFFTRLIQGSTGLKELEGLGDEEVAAAEDFTASSTGSGR